REPMSTACRQPVPRSAAASSPSVTPAPTVTWPVAASSGPIERIRSVDRITVSWRPGTDAPTSPVLPPCGTTGMPRAAADVTTAAEGDGGVGHDGVRADRLRELVGQRPESSAEIRLLHAPIIAWHCRVLGGASEYNVCGSPRPLPPSRGPPSHALPQHLARRA